MATISPTFVIYPRGVLTVTWANMADGDVGAPMDAPDFPDKTFTVTSSSYGGSTVTIQGSNDGTNYMTANDSRGEGNSLTFTANDVKAMGENPAYTRPSVGGGTGTGITVKCVAQSLMR